MIGDRGSRGLPSHRQRAAGIEQAAVVGAGPRPRSAPRRHRQAHSGRQVHQLADALQPDRQAREGSHAARHLVQQGAGDARSADPPGRRSAGDHEGRACRSIAPKAGRSNTRPTRAARAAARTTPNIPPYAENWRLTGITPVTEDITLYAMSPHMHLRGKSLKWVIVYPDGREQTILNVPKFDFNWQFNYELKEPLKIPAGSKILGLGVYDNSIRRTSGTRRRTSRSTGRSRAGTRCISQSGGGQPCFNPPLRFDRRGPRGVVLPAQASQSRRPLASAPSTSPRRAHEQGGQGGDRRARAFANKRLEVAGKRPSLNRNGCLRNPAMSPRAAADLQRASKVAPEFDAFSRTRGRNRGDADEVRRRSCVKLAPIVDESSKEKGCTSCSASSRPRSSGGVPPSEGPPPPPNRSRAGIFTFGSVVRPSPRPQARSCSSARM